MKRNQWNAPRRKGKPRRKEMPAWALFIVAFLPTVVLGLAYFGGWFDGLVSRVNGAASVAIVGTPPGERISFSFCHIGGGQNCVVDGDTIWLHGEKIRIADIDAPETHNFQCAAEKALGNRATARLQDLLESGEISLAAIDRDEDQYGRKLRIVSVSGESVGETLVDEGLARWYEGGRRPWC